MNNSLNVFHLSLSIYRLKLVWLTLCSVYTNCEVEFLPVYVPTEEEKNKPKFYATNVRNVMAK